jgi:hypothetical protein
MQRNMVQLDRCKPDICSSIEVQLKGVDQHLGLVLAFGDGILSEFIDAHKMVFLLSLIVFFLQITFLCRYAES